MLESKQNLEKTKSTSFDTKHGTTISWLSSPTMDNPQGLINEKPQYKKIYMEFLKNNIKQREIVKSSRQKQGQRKIKSFLSQSLQMRKRSDDFEQKFKSEEKMNKKKPIRTVSNALNVLMQKVGDTELQKYEQGKNLFFSQTKKVMQLEQECLLIKFFYKDKSQFVEKNLLKNQKKSFRNQSNPHSVNYLKSHSQNNSKHKRLQPNKKEMEDLMLTHNLPYYEKVTRINYIKKQKFNAEAQKKAHMNFQYKREKNFQQMKQVIRLNLQHLLQQCSTNDSSSAQVIEKQTKFNKAMRLFLRFAAFQHVKRIFYDHIDQQGTQKLIQFILENSFTPQLKEKNLNQIIAKILKHKIQPRIEFYDFIELIDTIQESYSVDLLEMTAQKYPHYFNKPEETFLHHNWEHVAQQLKNHKADVIIKLIFESASSKLHLKQYLPLKVIPSILFNAGISPNQIPRAKLFEFMYWTQKRPEGLNLQQFFFSLLMLGINIGSNQNKLKNVYEFLQKIKIKELLQ